MGWRERLMTWWRNRTREPLDVVPVPLPPPRLPPPANDWPERRRAARRAAEMAETLDRLAVEVGAMTGPEGEGTDARGH